MKNLFRAMIFLAIGFQSIACGQAVPVMVTASPIPPPNATQTSTVFATTSPTATATLEESPIPTYVPPTLIPTIDPALLPDLLNNALSFQNVDVNGLNAQRITGWEYGFGGGFCGGYKWLDSNHLLLYPRTGQARWGEGGQVIYLAIQPVVINVVTGRFWLPPSNKSESPFNCNQLNWSHELEILITTEIHGDTSTVSTFTYDGEKLASYPGSLLDVSPKGTKILITDNTVIDLHTNQKIELDWSLEDYQQQYFPENFFWTSDETRIYRCCYFYADLATGTSHRFERSDFQTVNADYLKEKELGFYRGQWVRDDTFFLATWSMVDDGDIRYLPLFNPANGTLYDARQMAGISADLSCPETNISVNGSYIWVECYDKYYLVNLTTFETNEYLIPDTSNSNVNWSMDEKFALIHNYNYTNETTQYYVMSLSSKELNTLPVLNPILPNPWQHPWWHPTDGVFALINEDAQKFELFNAQTMIAQEIILPIPLRDFVWSSSGERIALLAEDGSLWQIDYPKLESLVQLTPSLPDVDAVQWSPDGTSIAFVNGSDIYIIDITK